jgi:iron complex outermembrane receptor protein
MMQLIPLFRAPGFLRRFYLFLLTGLLYLPGSGQVSDSALSSNMLKQMSIEELMQLKVTSVSRRPEKLKEAASAIQVITREDILRSGATNIPEALRLAPNLQVAQISANGWIISARGFNAAFSNKLLVMIDGRSVYSPLFAGVFWDVQDLLLEDVDRIEVISGPGSTVWGANAVNGIINIITRNARETKGLYLSAAAGNFMQDFAGLRFGGKTRSGLSYRVDAQRNDYKNTKGSNGTPNSDKWGITRGGFRLDWASREVNQFMIEGNVYGGSERTSPASPMDGQNITARFVHTYSESSGLTLQVYFDRTWRHDIKSTITDYLETYDVDLAHRFPVGKWNLINWGAGYRFMHNELDNDTQLAGFIPKKKNMQLYSGFIQDELSLGSCWKFTLGTKLQQYTYSGFEVQPSARLAWMPDEENTVWAAVSRALRTPSRIDVDYYLPTYPVPEGVPNVSGGPDFISEKLIAYELGYHVQPGPKFYLSLALFYNQYNDLYSVEAKPGTVDYQIENGTEGYSNGIEWSGTCNLLSNWRIKGGYTYFFKQLRNKPGHVYDFSALGNDPKHQFLLQSFLDLPAGFQLDVTARYEGSRPNPAVPDYFTANARLGWTYRKFEISLNGQDLWQATHTEYLDARIPRNFYAKITCRL